MKLPFLSVLLLALLAAGPVFAQAPAAVSGVPHPEGLKPCAPDDPVAVAEARATASLGGEFLGCFQAERTTLVAGSATPIASELAFALALKGQSHTAADLDALMATTTQQWKDFDPLNKAFKETYIARLNSLIRANGPNSSPALVSVKPVLVSIDRLDRKSYAVTSIRTYVLGPDGRRVSLTRVNSDAVVLQGSHLIRLTIQRALSDPTDVAQVQGEIADWARATSRSAPPD